MALIVEMLVVETASVVDEDILVVDSVENGSDDVKLDDSETVPTAALEDFSSELVLLMLLLGGVHGVGSVSQRVSEDGVVNDLDEVLVEELEMLLDEIDEVFEGELEVFLEVVEVKVFFVEVETFLVEAEIF